MFFYPLRYSCTLCRSIQVLMKLFFFLYYQLSWALDTIMPLKCGTFSIKNISSIYMKLRCHIHLTIKFSFWTYFKNKFWYFNHLIYCVVHLQHLKDSFKENFLFCINILLTLLPVRYLFSLYALMFFVCKITVFSDSVYKDTNTPRDLLSNLKACTSTHLKPWLFTWWVLKVSQMWKMRIFFLFFLNIKDRYDKRH
jgi:hypothetical protein